ncbi:MAG: M48 family metallopeptidase [Limnohabitans sp.]|nr:M48 family metallopeptidase [Limnohabitans sp.]
MRRSHIWSVAGAAAVLALLPMVGCGGSGQKRQTKVAAEVVSSAVNHRSASTFNKQSELALVGVLDQPAVDVAPVALQVGSVNAFVHASADARSKVLGQLKRGDAVRKTRESDFIVPPITSKMDDLDGKANPKTLATWSYVECANGVKGWIPTRALVLPEFFATSSEERLRELKMNRAGMSSKGMVEKRKAKLFVGKGFGSEQDLAEPNPAKAKEIVTAAANTPARFDLLATDYFVAPKAVATPAVGMKLVEVDAAAAARADKARAEMADLEAGKAGPGVGDALSLLGVQDDNAIAAAKVGEVIAILMKPRSPTPVEESGLGELAVSVVIGKTPVLPDNSPISAYVQNVGLRVASRCSNPYPATGYRFVVVDYPQANAIATPGGVIMISTGMLKFLKSEDELASVLAHEVAHVEERQAMLSENVDDFAVLSDLSLMGADMIKDIVAKVLKDQKLSPVIVQLVQDQVAGMVTDKVKETLQELGTEMWQNAAQPGQSDECAADIRGVALASAAGYDGNALEAVISRLPEIVGSYGGASYSELRPQDLSSVRQVLPVVGPKAEPSRAQRWAKLQTLLGIGV